MPYSKKHAKRLLRELDLPSGVAHVLRHPSYWDPGFVTLFLDRCDHEIFHDPQTGLALARVAPDLALLVPEGTTPDEHRIHRERLVRAYATLGGAYRAVGRPDDGNEPYRRALKLSSTISPLAQADLYQRLAALRAYQKRFDDATMLLEKAIGVFREHERYDELGCAFAVLSFAHIEAERYSETLKAASEALCYTDPKKNERVHYSALHNFICAAIRSTDLEALGAAWPKIREARRLIRRHRRSLPKLKLYWVEGLLLHKLHLTKRAEQLYEKARKGFVELDAVYEIALVDLSLSTLYCVEGRWDELERLSRETLERFTALSHTDSETIAALELWVRSTEAHTLTPLVAIAIRDTVIRRTAAHRGVP